MRNDSEVAAELEVEGAVEYARKLTGAAPRPPAPPSAAERLAERDFLIAEVERIERAREDRKRELQPGVDAAIEEVERQKEPARRLERLQSEMAIAIAGTYEAVGKARRAIEKLAPPIIRTTADELKASLAANRDVARRERRERAISKIEALVFVPGDPRPKIAAILAEITAQDLEV